MSSNERYIRKMRNNPIGWRIESLEAVARSMGIKVSKRGGSHVQFKALATRKTLAIPAKRPIKPVYIKKFLILIDDCMNKNETSN